MLTLRERCKLDKGFDEGGTGVRMRVHRAIDPAARGARDGLLPGRCSAALRISRLSRKTT